MMAVNREYGWQIEKPIKKCHKYMLENEIATDVCFEVGLPDGPTVDIRAHKFPLISRSAVFESMFVTDQNRFESVNRIRIDDIKADVFRKVLTYIYSDEVEVSPESALPLWYAAEKYKLKKLSEKCVKSLNKSVVVDNVYAILNVSVLFDHEVLKGTCLTFISLKSEDVLKSDSFLTLTREALGAVLSLDIMSVNEYCVYLACINWAKYQLKTGNSIDSPTEEQIKNTLGDLSSKIRVFTMEEKEKDVVAKGNIINLEIANEAKQNNYKQRKLIKERCYKRLEKPSSYLTTTSSSLTIRTGHDCLLSGMSLYSSASSQDDLAATERYVSKHSWLNKDEYMRNRFAAATAGTYAVTIRVTEIIEDQDSVSDETLFEESYIVPDTGSSNPYRVMFKSLIPIHATKEYCIGLVNLHGTIGYAGSNVNSLLMNKSEFIYEFMGDNEVVPEIYFFPVR